MICRGGEFCARLEITDEYGWQRSKEEHGNDKLQNHDIISWEWGSE